MSELNIWLRLMIYRPLSEDCCKYDIRRYDPLPASIHLLGCLKPVECCRFIAKKVELSGLHSANTVVKEYSLRIDRRPVRVHTLAEVFDSMQMPRLFEIRSDQFSEVIGDRFLGDKGRPESVDFPV